PPPETVGNNGEPAGPDDPSPNAGGPLSGRYAVSQDAGGEIAAIANPDGTPAAVVTPFGDFTGGIRSALADFNGDGFPDLAGGTSTSCSRWPRSRRRSPAASTSPPATSTATTCPTW